MNPTKWFTKVVTLLFILLFLAAHVASAADLGVLGWYSDDRYNRFTGILRDAASTALPGVSLDFMASVSRDKLLTMITAGALPDVVAVHSTDTFPEAANLKAFTRLRVDSADLKSIPPELFQPFTRNGELLAIPGVVELSNMAINLSMLENAGLPPPSFDWNWNDLANIAKRLTVDQNGDGVPEIYGMSQWWAAEQFIGPYLYANGGSFMNNQVNGTKVTIDSEATIKTFEFLHSLLYEKKVAFPGQGWVEWQQGKVGITYMGTWSIGSARNSVTGKFNWDYIPFPKSPDTGRRAGRLSLIGLAVSAASMKQVEATRLATLIGSKEAQERLLKESLSAVPARLDLANSPYFMPPEQEPKSARRTIMDNLAGGYAVQDTIYPNSQMGSIVLKYAARILQAGDNPRIALTQAAQEMRAFLK